MEKISFKKKNILAYPSSSPMSIEKKSASFGERLYDIFVVKPMVKNVVGIAVSILGVANAKTFMVSLLFGFLILNIWQWTVECNFKKIYSLPILLLFCPFLVIKVMPYVQNKVSPADLKIVNLMIRPDGEHNLLVDIENKGNGDLSQTNPYLGLFSLKKIPIFWMQSKRPCFIRSGETTRVGLPNFPKTETDFKLCIIKVESKNLLPGYQLWTFYKYQDDWQSYDRYVGVVGEDEADKIDEIIKDVRKDFDKKNWGKYKWIKDILMTS